VAAGRYRDARVVLISMAFLASAGFLALHALATPGVLLTEPNVGFVIATPVGLIVAAGFAAASASALAGPRAATVLRWRSAMLAILLVAMAAWAVLSLADLPPLDGPPPAKESLGLLGVLSWLAVALYGFSAWRSVQTYRDRGGVLLLAMAAALVLLGEATIAVTLSRNWHASWWEWHVLMLVAFVAIALGARAEYRRSGSLTGAFGGLYLEATLGRIDRWHAGAIAAVAAAEARGETPDRVLAKLRREGATTDEVALLAEAASELRRLDDSFRPYLPSVVAEQLRTTVGADRLGGDEREVSVLFADLASFTAFSETRTPTVVIGMLNVYWAAVVPVIFASGGLIEQFAGDGVMAIFNAEGDQPDHARRAATAGLAIIEAGRPVAAAHPDWPIFRVGVNSGRAVVGHVGVEERHSFAAIGDTSNVAARLMAAGEPGQVVVARTTWEALGGGPGREPKGLSLGQVRVKGKRSPVEAWILRSVP
jgi:class 3 adenylate cyclase